MRFPITRNSISKNTAPKNSRYAAAFVSVVCLFFGSLQGLIFGRPLLDTFPKTFRDIADYRSQIAATMSIGIMKESQIDLNNDGRLDYLVYLSRGEGYYLDALLADNGRLVRESVPPSEDYEILISPEGRHALRIGRPLVPGNDACYADCSYSFKHVAFQGNSLIYVNDRYPGFNTRMVRIYETCIVELEAGLDKSGDERSTKHLINKYRELVGEAKDILTVSGADQSEFTRMSEAWRRLILENYPDLALADLSDLSPSVATYFGSHIASPHPSILNKDLDGNDLADFIMLLKNKTAGPDKLVFVVFLQTQRGVYQPSSKMIFDNPYRDTFLIYLSSRYMLGHGVGAPAVAVCTLSRPPLSVFSYDPKVGRIVRSEEEKAFILCR